jgi:hypothetical protein
MGGSSIAFSRKVKILELVMNLEFTWDVQVSKVCRNMLFTLKMSMDNVTVHTGNDATEIGDSIDNSAVLVL